VQRILEELDLGGELVDEPRGVVREQHPGPDLCERIHLGVVVASDREYVVGRSYVTAESGVPGAVPGARRCCG